MIDTNKALEVRLTEVDTKHLLEEMILPEHKSIDYILCVGDSLIVPHDVKAGQDRQIELTKCVVTLKKPKAAEAQTYMSDNSEVLSFLRTLIHAPKQQPQAGQATVL